MGEEYIDKRPGWEYRTAGAVTGGVNYVIAVGIDQYCNSAIKDFQNNCAKDCRDFLDTLKDRYENFQAYRNDEGPECLIDQDATKEKIEKRLDDFIDSDQNNISNNLIFYFSGHGDVINRTEDNTQGCLIPHGIKSLVYRNLISNSFLADFCKGLKVRHFLYLADACKSAAIFDEIKPSYHVANADTNKEERSKWAIVSSRANELSKAGKPGENSAFTSVLLNILKSNLEKDLLVTTLIGSLDGRFSGDHAAGQKPYSGRLMIDQTPNSGLFVFRQKSGLLRIKQRRDILRKKLRSFNYEDQRAEMINISQQKKSFTIFRGTPNCGLWHLSRLARQSAPINISSLNFLKISPSTLHFSNDLLVLGLFNDGLQTNLPSVEELRAHLLKLLQTDGLVVEIRYYSDPGRTDPLLPPRMKKMILDQLAGFVHSINNQRRDDNRLLLFVVDEEDCDYGKLYNNQKILDIETNYITRTNPGTLGLNKIKVWYQMMKDESVLDERLDDFNTLFDEVINKRIEDIFRHAQGFPGSFIRVVCKEAECTDLAHEILDPQ